MHTDYLRRYLEHRNNQLTAEDQALMLSGLQLRGTNSGYDLSVLKVDGNQVSGYSLKPFQLLRVDQRAFRKKMLTIGAQSVLLTTVNGWLPVLASLLLIVMDFEELHHKGLSDKQARVLLLLYLADGEQSIEDLDSNYKRRFGEGLQEEALRDILAQLVKLRLISSQETTWALQETIIYRR